MAICKSPAIYFASLKTRPQWGDTGCLSIIECCSNDLLSEITDCSSNFTQMFLIVDALPVSSKDF